MQLGPGAVNNNRNTAYVRWAQKQVADELQNAFSVPALDVPDLDPVYNDP